MDTLMASINGEEWLSRWIYNNFESQSDLLSTLSNAGVPCDASICYLALLISIDNSQETIKTVGYPHFQQMLIRLADQCAAIFQSAVYGRISHNSIALILFRNHFINLDEIHLSMAKIRQEIKRTLSASLTLGVGTHAMCVAEVPQSYRNAEIALSYQMLFGYGQDINYESISIRIGKTPQYPEQQHKTLIQSITSGNATTFEAELSLFFSTVYSQSIIFGKASVLHLLIEIYRCVGEEAHRTFDFITTHILLSQERLVSEQLRIIRTFGLAMIDSINSINSVNPYQEMMETIQVFIDSHYPNPDLSMVAICEHTQVSPNTVRRIFRENNLPTPKNYITQIRIDKACELLLSTNLSAKDISYKIGFADSRYFYAVFKKQTGYTAFQYRCLNDSADSK